MSSAAAPSNETSSSEPSLQEGQPAPEQVENSDSQDNVAPKKVKNSASQDSTAPKQGENSDNQDSLSMIKTVLMDTKLNDGGTKKSVWNMTLETFGMADGKHEKNDILVETIEIGLERLKECLAQEQNGQKQPVTMAQTQQTTDGVGASSWTKFVPFLNEFQATPDQLLTAFLKWAEQRTSGSAQNEAKKINVTKAHRRLTSYLDWMKQNASEFEEPLTLQSITPAAKMWDIQMSYDDEGQFIWWINLGGLDKTEIKKLEPRDHLRYVVWFSHVVMFDPMAQENGVILVQDFGRIGFWKLMTLFPPHLGAKLDRLTIGVLPVQMKKIYMFGAARWMSLFVGLIKPFLSQKMRDRLVVVPRTSDTQAFCDELVSRKNIPNNFGGLQGEAPRDVHFERYKS